MKAILARHFRVLTCEDMPRPVPKDHDVLLKVRAASLNPVDWHLIRGTPYIGRLVFGLRKPRFPRIGHDVAGQVEAVGKKVTQFKPGDEVFGMCWGTLGEYARAPARAVVLRPNNLTPEHAASLPIAGLTALQGLRDRARLRPGQKVLINGASGGVGTFAVQIAKWLGAEVTGVCSSGNLDLVRSLGADHVIDYTREDFARTGQRYDVLFDCVGNRSLSDFRRVLEPKGIYASVGIQSDHEWLGTLPRLINTLVSAPFVSHRTVVFMPWPNHKDLSTLAELVTSGTITPVIAKRYVLEEAPEAMRYLATGHARGKVVITLEARSE